MFMLMNQERQESASAQYRIKLTKIESKGDLKEKEI